MKKLFRFFFVLSLITTMSSCQEEKSSTVQDGVSGAASSAFVQAGNDIDFDKKKDESCDTEEDLEKQIEEAKKKQEAFKLQGGDPGCTTD